MTIRRYPPISPKLPHSIHGGDYNPDQWRHAPDVLEEDMRLMKLAGCNAMTVGVFAWAALEPQEGAFDFGWLDETLDRLHRNGAFAVLATPSGGKPAWMSEAYPEIRQMTAGGVREPHGMRHNHCRTSHIYREKCRIINTELARRYADHPALLIWHVSNEYRGHDCHCPLCHEAFRTWLNDRYENDLDALNRAWYTSFWGHTYSDWSQIRPLNPWNHGLMLDWERFKTDQTIDFFRAEIEPLREFTPDIPVTTNFMGLEKTLDHWRFAPEVDVISWGSYPAYHDRPESWLRAVRTSLEHNLNRSFQRKPYLMMECSPGTQNWMDVNKLKRPGLHVVEAVQAIAHGSDSVQFFQWRKNQGSFEKLHGAAVDHCGSENTRVFREVADVGSILASLDDIVGTTTPSEVAILIDWENWWALDSSSGPRTERKDYIDTCAAHYRPFWSAGVSCDVVNEESDLSGFKLVIAPMLYMVRPGFADRVEAFVRGGGTFVTTYLSGIVDETDLCFLGGFPGPLREILGIWAEEIDVLYDDESVPVRAAADNTAGLTGTYTASVFCDLIHAETAQVLATYGGEFYAGRPAATANAIGAGRAFYIASRNDTRFLGDLYRQLMDNLELSRALRCDLPDGVTAQVRTDGERTFVFVLGFHREAVRIELGSATYCDLLTGDAVAGSIDLPPYSVRILEAT